MRTPILALFAAVPALLARPTPAVELATGDILVANGDGSGALVHIDPLTGDRTPTTTLVAGHDPWGLAFDPVRRVVYKGDEVVPAIYQEDPATGIQTAISRSRGVVPTGSGPALKSVKDVLVEPGGTLAVADFDHGVPSALGALWAVDPASGARAILSSSAVGSGPPFSPTALARDADGSLLVLNGLSSSLGVVRVAADTGDRTVVSSNSLGSGPAFVSPVGIAVDPAGVVFVADAFSDHVLQIDPATGNRTVLSSSSVGTGPVLSLPRDLALEASGDLLVYDAASADRKLLRIDRASGNRTVVASASVGSGPALLFAEAIALEATGAVLVVGASGDLLRVDAVTGDRVLLASSAIGAGPDFEAARGLAVEPDGSAVVGDASLFAVLRVDLATGDRTPVSATPPAGSIPIGSGPDLGAARHLRVEPSGTLLVAHAGFFFPVAPGILRVWPETGDRETVSSAARGSGPAWRSPADLELTADGRLFVVDAGLDAVLEVDPRTGDRSLVTGQGVGSGPALSSPIGIAAEAGGRLLVVDQDLAAVVGIDVDSGARSLVSGAGAGSGASFLLPTELALEADGSILVTDFPLHAVFRVDPRSGFRRVMSANGGPGGGTAFLDVVRGIAVVVERPDVLPPVVLAPAGIRADASGPEGAVVLFATSAQDDVDGPLPVTCNPPSGSTFPVGTSEVRCSATDAAGNLAEVAFPVHVSGAEEQLAELLAAARQRGMGPGRSVEQKLARAQAALAGGSPEVACRLLSATSHEATARSRKRNPAPGAAQLVEATQRIRDALGC